MKKFSKYFWLLAAPLSLGLFAACSNSDEPDDPSAPKNPVVTIARVTPAAESVSFMLTLSNADAYEYGCFETSDYEANGAGELTRVESATADDAIVVSGLTPETSYTLVAVACAGATRSAERTQQFETTAAAESETPVIAIENVAPTHESVTFDLSTVSGLVQNYCYVVYEEGTTASQSQYQEVAAVEGEAVTVKVDNLDAETSYVIEAYGINDGLEDNEGEHVSESFVTEAIPTEPLPFGLSLMELTTDPETNAQVLFDSREIDLSTVAEIRYVNLDRTSYRQSPILGRADSVRVRLSAEPLMYSAAQTIVPADLSRGNRFPRFSDLVAGTNYYFFAVLKYNDGTFSPMGELEYTQPSYNTSGLAGIDKWERANSTQEKGGSESVSFSITPNSSCTEMWVWVSSTPNAASNNVSTLINEAKTQPSATMWYHKGTEPWTTPSVYLSNNSDYYMVFVCKDADGNYNDVVGDRVGIKSLYSTETDPEPGEEGSGELPPDSERN